MPIKNRFLDSFFVTTGKLFHVGYWLNRAFRYDINTYRIPLKHLPTDFDGYRMAIVSDIHYGPFMRREWVKEICEKTNQLDVDTILCLGDYSFGYHAKDTDIQWVWSCLETLKAPDGVFMILGNHDHCSNEVLSKELLVKSACSVRHQAKPIKRGNSQLWLVGLGDLRHDELGIEAAFKDIPEDDIRVVLAHNPDTMDEPIHDRMDLMLSGHTHGGQVCLPGWGPIMNSVINKRYISGVIQTERCPLFISRGLGYTLFPLRVCCSPEIAILELKQA